MNKVALGRVLLRLVLGAAAFALVACQREERQLVPPTTTAATVGESHTARSLGIETSAGSQSQPDENNAYAMSQGKMFFAAYNCTGCHAQGGGDKGPALMDDVWIYGADPANVFASIVDGRPNGMPAFRDRIPEYQVWQLVAYVRSMSGLVSSDAAPGRNDAMQAKIPEQATDKQPPKQAAAPPGLAGSR